MPEMGKYRPLLSVSPLFDEEVKKVLQQIRRAFGTSEYVSVHMRIEPDWYDHCHQDSQRNTSDCWIDQDQVLSHLTRQGITKNSLVFIASESGLGDMQRLCLQFTCFKKEDVWVDRSSTIPTQPRLVRAYMDFLLSLEGYQFFGNRHSSFAMEIRCTFRQHGKHATFFNPKEGDDFAC